MTGKAEATKVQTFSTCVYSSSTGVARPILYHSHMATCWQPYVKNMTVMVNSSYNGFRYEDVWLDK